MGIKKKSIALSVGAMLLASTCFANSITRINKYLYDAYYDVAMVTEQNYLAAKQELDKKMPPRFACTSARKGNFHMRNLDLFKDDTATFIVHVPATYRSYKYMGVAGGLQDYKAGHIKDTPDLLPFVIVDGINEHGLVVNINVVPADVVGIVSPKVRGNNVSAIMFPAYVLRHYKTVDDVLQGLNKDFHIYDMAQPGLEHYSFHFMVSDKDQTAIIEHNAKGEWLACSNNIMVNFNEHLRKAYDVEPTGAGIERYKLVESMLPYVQDMESAMDVCEAVKYSQAYTHWGWISENYGELCNKYTNPADIYPAWNAERKVFLSGKRNTGVWHTMHSVVYNLASKEMLLAIQEDYAKTYARKLE